MEAIMGNDMGAGMASHHLTVDALAIGGLVGFGALLLIMTGITVWVVRKAFSAPPSEPPKE
ncbi:MAG TPA: hypothetical protein PK417_07955 [Hyphomonas sp.]|nr:hypothetical protein [Hyphomonas sp.]